MNKSSTRGVFLSLVLLCLTVVIIIPINAYAAENISVKSFSLDATTIIEFTNSGTVDVNSFRIWLGSDNSFKSFKTESVWIGEKTPQGVIIFTSSESVKPGESVKFGIKTDKINPVINWKALDKNEKQIEIGISTSEELPKGENTVKQNSDNGILANSMFRIIPEKPSAGSTIRVTGDNFGASNQFDIYIDTNKIGTFQTDKDGHFMTTVKIPTTQNTNRVDFSIKDKTGSEKKISLRIGEIINRIPETENVKLSVNGVPPIMYIGDLIQASGTAQPSSGITITIKDENGSIINTRTTNADSKGIWKLEPITISGDISFGVYSAVVSDGKEEKTISWTLKNSKTILITPTSLRFEPGDIMKFNGTAQPNKELELILEGPLGVERHSEIVTVPESGIVNFEYPTTLNIDKEGTWTLIATQDGKTEFIYAGLGQLPQIPINAKFNKLNYISTETADISLSGNPGEKVSITIIDPSDKEKKFSDGSTEIFTTLEQDGRKTYHLDLTGYTSGVYTAIIKKANAQTTEIFTVGLQAGSGDIKISPTKLEYRAGDPILILGNTNPNSFLTIELYDPDGKIVTSKETFSDKNGKISNNQLRMPGTAKLGTWTINVKSGPNFDKVKVEVVASKEQGLVVSTSNGVNIPGFGNSIDIKVSNAAQQVVMEIISSNGVTIETLTFPASGKGEIKQPWFIPKSTPTGTYTLRVTDAKDTAETTFIIN